MNEEEIMQLSNVYRLEHQQMVSGLFSNDQDVYHAREILTDFGYPKEAANVVVLSKISKEIKNYGKGVARRLNSRVFWGLALWSAVVLIVGALAGMRYYPELGISELALLIGVWTGVVAICTVVCAFIGALAAGLISSVVAKEYEVKSETIPTEERILISVAVRTPADARDIAHEWEQIGGQVVQMPESRITQKLAA